MAVLHELLAVEADLQNTVTALINDGITTLSKKPDHFLGHNKSTHFLEASRSGEDTSEDKLVVTTVDEKLDYVFEHVVKYYDALIQKEATNGLAKADLIVNGKVLAKDVPATMLLGLETRLKQIRALCAAAPTLPPAVRWELDPNTGKGIFRSPPATTFKTEKTVKHKVLVEATKEHKAEIEKWNEDVPVARVDTIQFSGMWTVHYKAEVLDRIEQLMVGVKQSRQRANIVEVDKRTIGKELIEFILG